MPQKNIRVQWKEFRARKADGNHFIKILLQGESMDCSNLPKDLDEGYFYHVIADATSSGWEFFEHTTDEGTCWYPVREILPERIKIADQLMHRLNLTLQTKSEQQCLPKYRRRVLNGKVRKTGLALHQIIVLPFLFIAYHSLNRPHLPHIKRQIGRKKTEALFKDGPWKELENSN